MVSTPDGSDVAMIHCNNCCSELDAWVKLFGEFASLTGNEIDKSELYSLLYKNAMKGDVSGGGITAYNFLSGEPVAGVEKGKPMYFRSPDGEFNLANFFRVELMTALSALKMGNDILFEKEKVKAKRFAAHGGLFKVEGAADALTANAMNVPITVMTTAGEGGAWGMALLAGFMKVGNGKELSVFLEEKVFKGAEKRVVEPDEKGVEGFKEYMKRFIGGLEAEKAAGMV